MPDWFAPTELYTRTIKLGDEEATVTLRVLDSGVKAELEDSVRMHVSEGPDGEAQTGAEVLVGTMKLLTVERAVVSWTIPGAEPTPATIRRLHPEVTEAIFKLCSFDGIPAEVEDGTDPSKAKPAPEAEPTPEPEIVAATLSS
jgi:hypothetical protein